MAKLDESRTASTQDDYETPEHVLERVREIFGGQIDLDPCTSVRNNTRARVAWTSGGLEAPWEGNVFVNPPYGPALKSWVNKAIEETHRCPVTRSIITLTPARPDTQWYHTLVTSAAYHAQIRGRLKFSIAGVPAKQSCQFPCTLALLTCSDRHVVPFLRVMSRDSFARIEQVIETKYTQHG